jgi:tyrosyl-tRNA synthetase
VLVSSGLCPSRSDARRAVEQGGVTVNDEKVTDVKTLYDKDAFSGDGMLVKRGKKSYKKVVY